MKVRYAWKNVSPKDLGEIRRLLMKTGLDLAKGKIVCFDHDRWTKYSMKVRYAFRMPSCTNSLERDYGHMNAFMPITNNFWASLKRLIEQKLKRNHNFNINFTRNYTNYKGKIQRIVRCTPKTILDSMVK